MNYCLGSFNATIPNTHLETNTGLHVVRFARVKNMYWATVTNSGNDARRPAEIINKANKTCLTLVRRGSHP